MDHQFIKKFLLSLRIAMRPTHNKKLVFFFIGDVLIIAFSLYFSFLFRFDFVLEERYRQMIFSAIPYVLIVKVISFIYFNLYWISWRYVSLKDFYNIIKSVIAANIVLALVIYFFRPETLSGFPRGILVVDAVLTLLLVACLRVSKRAFIEVLCGTRQSKGKRVIIIGAGNTGEMILRDIQKAAFENYAPVAFLDDDLNRVGTYLRGIKVAGTLGDLGEAIRIYRASVIIIAIPALKHTELLGIYKKSKEAEVEEIKIVPRIYDIQRPQFHAHTLEDIKIEDLIGRQAVDIDYQEIGRTVEDKTVLVTGAGGSIGFELVQQLCGMNPRQLILFDIDETELYRAQRILGHTFSGLTSRLRFFVGDIRDEQRVRTAFEQYKPEIVFHAAAYKHVPMMEENAAEAVKVNIVGTYNVASAAALWVTQRFIMISTDKAVRPTSIMGATKRVAEYVCRAFNACGKTEFISVRFGNVLGSRGSVLPLFLEQIEKGGPITVTHKDMRRYFMTIPEAVSLVLQASVIGKGGDIMALDMGEPVKIVDLAEQLIRLHELTPYKDIAIEFVGLRPGEKLFEEILTAEEGTVATRHKKVFIAQGNEQYSIPQIEAIIARFRAVVAYDEVDNRNIKQMLKECVRWYEENQPFPVGDQSLLVPMSMLTNTGEIDKIN